MTRRGGAGHDAYTFDLEPDGDPDGGEDDDAAPVVRSTHPSPASAGVLLIDLDPAEEGDDLDVDPGPGGALPGSEPDGRAGVTLRETVQRLRGALQGRRLVVAVVLVAAALAAVVVDTVGDRGRLAALRDAPGGVLDLSQEPHAVWRVDAQGSLPGGVVGVLDGLAVAQSTHALIGLDAETGEKRWQVPLPRASTDCGPGLQDWSGSLQTEPLAHLVCVSATADGDGERSTVTVVDAEGEVEATREVSAPSSRLYPGSDGGLVTVDWVGDADPVDPHVADDVVAGVATEGAIPDGYDLRVRVEDAVTGEPRWATTVLFDGAVDPAMCVRWEDDGTTPGVDLRGGVQVMVTDRLVWLGGCGIDAWFTPDGVRLDRPQDPGTFDGFAVEALEGGGYVAGVDGDLGAVPDPADVDRVLSDDGTEVREVRGRYLAPASTDGGGDGVHLERRGSATVATDDDGGELWRADVRSSALLVRTAQVAVVVDGGRRLYGLDLGTGETLWMRPDLVDGLDGIGAYGPRFVEAAFTDGRLAAFVVPDYTQGDVVHWVALDVTSGRQLWQMELGGDGWGTELAVDGRIVRWSPTEIVGLG